LIDKKYNIIFRNYLIKGGEIDIIAWHKKQADTNTLCFIEVKTRKYDDGSAERATGKQKLNHLFRAAKKYCIENNIDTNHTPIQFEQVSVYTNAYTNEKTKQPKIAHFIITVD